MPIPETDPPKSYLPFAPYKPSTSSKSPTPATALTKKEYDQQMRELQLKTGTSQMTDLRSKTDFPSRITKPYKTSDIITDPDEKEYYRRAGIKAPDNFIQRNIRTALPFPNNASAYAVKKISGYGNMNNDDLSYEDKSVLYKVIDNAQKRTGKMSGGTEYEDYNGTMDPDAYKDVIKDVKPAHIGVGTGLKRGYTSPGFDMATTVGRMSYAKDPATGKVIITDNYDFKNNMTNDSTGAVKKGYLDKPTGNIGQDIYRWFRKSAANDDADATIGPEEKQRRFEKTRSQFSLSPADTIRRKVYPRVP